MNASYREASPTAAERLFQWRGSSYRPVAGLVWSGLAHVFFALCFVLAAIQPFWRIPRERPESGRVARLTAAPRAGSQEKSQPAEGMSPSSRPAPRAPDLPEVKVDLSALRVEFSDDPEGQLPAVLVQQHGMLAWVDRDDSTIARYLFDTPSWDPQEAPADISSRLRIIMDPPQRWAVLREIASRYAIPMDRYRVCAVFDIAFRRCLLDAIRRQAEAQKLNGRIAEVRLAFSMNQPCGVEVQEVAVAASPAKAL
jgi:hypothetical protein